MTQLEEKTYRLLEERGIVYQVSQHPAVFTIQEMEELGITAQGMVCKNLFLRDDKGRRHFLVVVRQDKQADLKKLAALLGSSRLGFASEERLMKYLGLTKGSVTPLGIWQDESRQVEVVLDEDLQEEELLGVHPCVNTATLWLRFADLFSLLREHGNPMRLVKI